jgi:hypothetical protein
MASCGGTGTSNGRRQGWTPVSEPCADVAVSRTCTEISLHVYLRTGSLASQHSRICGAGCRVMIRAMPFASIGLALGIARRNGVVQYVDTLAVTLLALESGHPA